MSVRETMPRPDSGNEPTQAMDLSDLRDYPEDQQRTVVIPSNAPGGSTVVEPTPPSAAEEREHRRAERDRALGTRRPAPDAETSEEATQRPRFKRTTDGFLGAFGLFLLRLVVAAIMGLHGFAKAMDIGGVQTMLGGTLIPEPVIMSYVLAGVEIAIALALVFGLLTRLAGLGVALIGIGALVFVHWTTNPLVGNSLNGELELLLGAVGVLFICLGAGGWSIDGAVRRRRAAAKS